MRKFIVHRSSLIVNSLILFFILLTIISYLLPITRAQSQACSGGSSLPRAEGLVTTPSLSGIFNTSSGRCITNEQRAAYVSFKIPTYEDLKSIYYTQTKTSKTTQLANNNQDYLYNTTGDLTITSPSDITGSNTGVIFIDKNLTIGPISSNKFTQGNKDSGVVFVVGGDVAIDSSITQIDAVIISSGTIYTAGGGCSTSSVTSSQLVVNGSLISLNSTKPIKFCRKLTNNSLQPSEKVNWDPKYLGILKDLFSDPLQKWSEIP